MSKLFSSFESRGLTLRNRIVVAPMLTAGAQVGHATPWHLVHIGRFALGGAGLVIMESTKVEKRGRGTLYDLGLWDDAFVPGLADIVSFAHRYGAAIGIQLGHTGRKSAFTHDEQGEALDMVAPSAIAHAEGRPVPRALELSEIPDVIGAFVAAARRADAAGFDVIELHGAHGYLLHSFLSPVANQRTDRYGGSEENRKRLMLEVTEAVRAQWPADKPLFMRLSCEDLAGVGLEQIVPLARELKALGVDVIDCSSGGMRDDMREIPGVAPDSFGYQVRYAEQIRRDAGIPTMAVGHIIHPRQAEDILQSGRADLIAIAREMLYNPNWAIDAAQKLGEDPDFELLPPNVRGPMASRRRRFKGNLSTHGSEWRAEALTGTV
jgi:2,4-dienoyl-CoA reductase-like NADH-dependent reductase (Old Yellow Enzyme family)